MQVKELMSEISPLTFIDEYLSVIGVEDVKTFRKPNKKSLDNVEDYKNIDKAYEIINNILK